MKVQNRFIEFEDQFLPTNPNSSAALSRRQALIDMVFKKMNETVMILPSYFGKQEEDRKMEIKAVLQRIESGENKTHMVLEKMMIQEANFIAQTKVIEKIYKGKCVKNVGPLSIVYINRQK